MAPRKSITRPITLQADAPDITFGELVNELVRFKRLRNLTPRSIEFYEDCGRYFGDFLGEDVMCDTITEGTYYDYIEFLDETKPDLKAATLRSYLTGVRAILYYGMKKGYIQQFNVELPKADEVVKETYTDQEIRLLLKKPDMKTARFSEYRNWVLVNYMLGIGNRAGTIVAIKIEDVDFDSGTIILKKLKARKQYVIPLSRSLAQILQDYLTYRKGEPGDYLFCNAYGKPLTVDMLQKDIARYNNRRGIDKTSLHMFRHTFAKQWILNGGDIFRLQKILGHSCICQAKNHPPAIKQKPATEQKKRRHGSPRNKAFQEAPTFCSGWFFNYNARNKRLDFRLCDTAATGELSCPLANMW